MFTLQTLPACKKSFKDVLEQIAGSSLHAGVAAKADLRLSATARNSNACAATLSDRQSPKSRKQADVVDEPPTPTEHRSSMIWASQARIQRGRPGIDIETCTGCGGTVKVIVGMPNYCIEDPIVIWKIRYASPA